MDALRECYDPSAVIVFGSEGHPEEPEAIAGVDALMLLYEPAAAFATQPGILASSWSAVRESLGAFTAMKGTLDLKVTRVLEASDLALVVGTWSFAGTGPEGEPVKLTGHNADVLRRQSDGSWRFVIDNPWGTD